jgi:hypothetical protein
MKTIDLFKRIIIAVLLFCSAMPVFAQTKPSALKTQNTVFYQLLNQSDLQFIYPAGFKEIPAVNDEDFSFDFAMELPAKGFECWFEVKSQKQNWISYQQNQYNKNTRLANPDSMYMAMGKAYAIALTGDDNFMTRNMPPEVLTRYNADAGKSYLLNLLDLPDTKHYKYALLICLQKNHTGTLVAIYFTNQKDPEFYQEVYRASHSLRFKSAANN